MRKRLLVTLSFLAATAFASAAPLFDEPVPELHLTNGEVLHDVQAKSFNSTSVMVRYSEGGRTIAYDLFPAEYKSLVLARKPTAKVASAVKPTPVATKVDPKKIKEDAPEKPAPDTFNGLVLKSYSAGGGTGYMQTEIYNDTDEPAKISAFSLQAELDNGKIVNGRHFIQTDGDGKIQSTLKSLQEIEPHSSVTLKPSFPIPPGVTVTKVTWSQS